MDIILDANILRNDLKFRDKVYEILNDYLIKTDSKYVLPSVVIEEIKALYERALKDRYEEYKKSDEKLRNTLLFVEMPPTLEKANIETDITRYIEFLHQKLGTADANIVPYKNEYLPELVFRAVHRKKPLDNKGQQFRDGLLWLTVLDYAETTQEKIVAFISENVSDFSEKGQSQLAKELEEEATQRGVTVRYFRSLSDFAKAHASPIAFINVDWVNKNIDFKVTEDLISAVLGEREEKKILSDLNLDRNERATGYISKTDYVSSKVLEFFVYEKQDGTILLNVEIEFEIEYEIEIEKTVEKDNSRYGYIHKVNRNTGEVDIELDYIPDLSMEVEQDYRFDQLSFRGNFILTILDGRIQGDYELDDWDWG